MRRWNGWGDDSVEERVPHELPPMYPRLQRLYRSIRRITGYPSV